MAENSYTDIFGIIFTVKAEKALAEIDKVEKKLNNTSKVSTKINLTTNSNDNKSSKNTTRDITRRIREEQSKTRRIREGDNEQSSSTGTRRSIPGREENNNSTVENSVRETTINGGAAETIIRGLEETKQNYTTSSAMVNSSSSSINDAILNNSGNGSSIPPDGLYDSAKSFKNNLNEASFSLAEFATSAFLSALSMHAVTEAQNNAIKLGQNAEYAGMGVKSYSELGMAMERQGGNKENMYSAINSITDSFQGLFNGNSGNYSKLMFLTAKLGLSGKFREKYEHNKVAGILALSTAAEKYEKAHGKQDTINLLKTYGNFDTANSEILIKGGANLHNNMLTTSKDAITPKDVEIAKQYHQQIAELEQDFTKASTELGADFIPILKLIVANFKPLLDVAETFVAVMTITKLIRSFISFVSVIKDFVDVMKEADVVTAVLDGLEAPIILPILALVAACLLVYEIFEHWGEIIKVLKIVFKDVFNFVIDIIKDVGDAIKDYVLFYLNLVKDGIDDISKAFKYVEKHDPFENMFKDNLFKTDSTKHIIIDHNNNHNIKVKVDNRTSLNKAVSDGVSKVAKDAFNGYRLANNHNQGHYR